MNPCETTSKQRSNAGFALIASLSIMAVLVLIGVALYSLSSVATRSAEIAKARTEAQANAKMALMQAIGNLQAELGPDQRISANAAIFDTDPDTNTIDDIVHQHWVGVWDSWKAGGTSGSAHSTIQGVSDGDVHPEYSEKSVNNSDGGYFRSWLVSLPDNRSTNILAANNTSPALQEPLTPSLRPGRDANSVFMVHQGSLGDLSDELNLNNINDRVAAGLIAIQTDGNSSNATGRFSWWIGDESQKARLMGDAYDDPTSPLSTAEKIYRQYAPGAYANKLIRGLEAIDESNLERLPDYESLDLVDNVTGDPTPSKMNFYHATTRSFGVLTDVREGGLKRDLSTLLEQPIDIEDTANIDKYMLYEFDDPRFNDRKHSRVPIQDLSAYYQLYEDDPDFSESRRGGVEFTGSAIKVTAPDFGDSPGDQTEVEEKYLREYTTLYRNPVPIRVQFVVGIFAEQITDTERTEADIPERLTHKVVTSITPVLTMWNPNNVSMTLRAGDAYSQVMKMTSPALYLEWTKYRHNETQPITTNPVNLRYMTTGDDSWHNYSEIASMALSDNTEVNFEPGEVKIFSIPTNGDPIVDQPIYEPGNHGQGIQSAEPGWDPSGLQPTFHSAQGGADVYQFPDNRRHLCIGTYNAGGAPTAIDADNPAGDDFITFGIYPVEEGGQRNVSRHSKVAGSVFNFWLQNKPYTRWRSSNSGENLINYMFTSTGNGELTWSPIENTEDIIPYNQDLILMGFPNGQAIEPEAETESISGQDLIRATIANETFTLFQFTMTAASEVNSDQMSLGNAGRRNPARPYLHSSSIAPSFLDSVNTNTDSLLTYNFGWEWQVEKINSMDAVPIQADGEKSYYGGGYTGSFGNSHIVQREIPIVPPISIASLSHAHLGGYSLADEASVEYNSTDANFKRTLRDITRSQGYQRVTAHGFAGLAPHTLQAIGNSYAHPMMPADEAFTTWTRTFDLDETQPENVSGLDPLPDSWGGTYNVPSVDHAYLANKALWDEYFFSSIAPQPPEVDNPLFEGSGESSAAVADGFFFNDPPLPLPNRRFVPYKVGLAEETITDLYAGDPLREDGPIDAIASHTMVKGPFNINSTSVEAWKAFLASHREEAIHYYEGSTSLPMELDTTETPVGYGGMGNLSNLISSSDTNDAKNVDQWRTWRSISDAEIEQLARAIVYQVKLRGPFLSLSEFINRRLEPHDDTTELSLKGALQAALDFKGIPEGAGLEEDNLPEVTINKEFRSESRSLDSELTSEIRGEAAYEQALEGPVAYGSAPYVDQADLLRSFAGQLTPRGDTFVIRAYGDKLDASGNVIARAWCEAVVQRTPEYLQTVDNDHTAHENLTSDTNKNFGRKISIVSFRWLNEDEV